MVPLLVDVSVRSRRADQLLDERECVVVEVHRGHAVRPEGDDERAGSFDEFPGRLDEEIVLDEAGLGEPTFEPPLDEDSKWRDVGVGDRDGHIGK